MPDKQPSNNSTQQSDWLHTITQNLSRVQAVILALIAAAAALLTILNTFVSDKELAEQLSYVVVGALIIGTAALSYFKRPKPTSKILEPVAQDISRAALRSIMPFDEGDKLIGRTIELHDIYTMVSQRNHNISVVYGGTGTGKTSLIRAGLLPLLRERGFVPIYVPSTGHNPSASLATRILQVYNNLLDADSNDLAGLFSIINRYDREPKIVIFDQFEELFVLNRNDKNRHRIIRELAQCADKAANRSHFVFIIRSDYFEAMHDFDKYRSETINITCMFKLLNFGEADAREVLRLATQQDHIEFSDSLIDAVISDIAVERTDKQYTIEVRPVELQIVATRMKRLRITIIDQYIDAGRKHGLLRSYLSEVIAATSNQKLSEDILAKFAKEDDDNPVSAKLDATQVLQLLEPNVATDGALDKQIQSTLRQLVEHRLLVPVGSNEYKLAHDYLASLILRAFADKYDRSEQAKQSLNRYITEYDANNSTYIPWRTLRTIECEVPIYILNAPTAKKLLRQSRRHHYLEYIRISAVAIIGVLVTVGITSNTIVPHNGWREIDILQTTEVHPLRQIWAWTIGKSGEYVLFNMISNRATVVDMKTHNRIFDGEVTDDAHDRLGMRYGAIAINKDNSLLAIYQAWLESSTEDTPSYMGETAMWIGDLRTGQLQRIEQVPCAGRVPTWQSNDIVMEFNAVSNLIASYDAQCGIALWDVKANKAISKVNNEELSVLDEGVSKRPSHSQKEWFFMFKDSENKVLAINAWGQTVEMDTKIGSKKINRVMEWETPGELWLDAKDLLVKLEVDSYEGELRLVNALDDDTLATTEIRDDMDILEAGDKKAGILVKQVSDRHLLTWDTKGSHRAFITELKHRISDVRMSDDGAFMGVFNPKDESWHVYRSGFWLGPWRLGDFW